MRLAWFSGSLVSSLFHCEMGGPAGVLVVHVVVTLCSAQLIFKRFVCKCAKSIVITTWLIPVGCILIDKGSK